jgi:hypothetical protein
MGRSALVRAPQAPREGRVVSGQQLLIYAISQKARVIGDRNTGDPDVRLVEFDEFLELNVHRPADVVLSPMVGDTYDCIDVAQHLFSAGFSGSYRVMTPDLPDPGILRQEIRSLCPGLDFDLVALRTLSGDGLN